MMHLSPLSIKVSLNTSQGDTITPGTDQVYSTTQNKEELTSRDLPDCCSS